MLNYLWFLLAALCEIGGCYAFWLWQRQGRSALWVIAGLLALSLFALLLTRVEAQYAGRAYAAYGGIYVASSLAWMMWVEGVRPQPADLLGALLCVLGAGVILSGGRLGA